MQQPRFDRSPLIKVGLYAEMPSAPVCLKSMEFRARKGDVSGGCRRRATEVESKLKQPEYRCAETREAPRQLSG
jgi:hypothetical protein